MGNKKKSEKLAIPEWFSLQKYKRAEQLKPLGWFIQLALRIDITLILDGLNKQRDLSSEEKYLCRFDDYEDFALYAQSFLEDNPIPGVDEVRSLRRDGAEDAGSRSFPTLSMLEYRAVGVRELTVGELYHTELRLDPYLRNRARLFYDGVSRQLPQFEGSWPEDWWDESYRSKVDWKHHADKLRSEIIRQRDWGLGIPDIVYNMQLDQRGKRGNKKYPFGFYEESLDEPLSHYEVMKDTRGLCTVDPSMPRQQAIEQFARYYDELQAKKRVTKGKRKISAHKLDNAKWCAHGLLPFIDLTLWATQQAEQCKNSRIGFTEATLAAAIYRPSREPDTIGDVTRPLARKLQDPHSPEFQELLAAAASELINGSPF